MVKQILIIVGISLLATAGQALGDPYTWNGSESTDWNALANWTPEGVPVDGDNVVIANVTTD